MRRGVGLDGTCATLAPAGTPADVDDAADAGADDEGAAVAADADAGSATDGAAFAATALTAFPVDFGAVFLSLAAVLVPLSVDSDVTIVAGEEGAADSVSAAASDVGAFDPPERGESAVAAAADVELFDDELSDEKFLFVEFDVAEEDVAEELDALEGDVAEDTFFGVAFEDD